MNKGSEKKDSKCYISKRTRRAVITILLIFAIIFSFPLFYAISLILGYIIIPNSFEINGVRNVLIGDELRAERNLQASESIIAIDNDKSGGIFAFPEIEFDKTNPLLRVFVGATKILEWNFTSYSLPSTVPESFNTLKNNIEDPENTFNTLFGTYSQSNNPISTVFSLPVEASALDVEQLYTRRLEVVEPLSNEEVILIFNNIDDSVVPSPQGLTASSYSISPVDTQSAYLSLEGNSRINFIDSYETSMISIKSEELCIGEGVCFSDEGLKVKRSNIINGALNLGKTVVKNGIINIPNDFTIDHNIGAVLVLDNLDISGVFYLEGATISSDMSSCVFTGPKSEKKPYIFSNKDGISSSPFVGPECGKIVIDKNLSFYAEEHDINDVIHTINIGEGYFFEFYSDSVKISEQLKILDSVVLGSSTKIGEMIEPFNTSSDLFEFDFKGLLEFIEPDSKIVGTLRSFGTSFIINGVELLGPENPFLFVKALDGTYDSILEEETRVIINSPFVFFGKIILNNGAKIGEKFMINESFDTQNIPLSIMGPLLNIDGNIKISNDTGLVDINSLTGSNSMVFDTSENVNIEVPIISPIELFFKNDIYVGDSILISDNKIEYSKYLTLGSEGIIFQVGNSDTRINYGDLSIESLLVGRKEFFMNDYYKGSKINFKSDSVYGIYIDGFNFYNKSKMTKNIISTIGYSLGIGYDALTISALKFHDFIIFNNILYSHKGFELVQEEEYEIKFGNITICMDSIVVEGNLLLQGLEMASFIMNGDLFFVDSSDMVFGKDKIIGSNIEITNLSLNNENQTMYIKSEETKNVKNTFVVKSDISVSSVNFGKSRFEGGTLISDSILINNPVIVRNKLARNANNIDSVINFIKIVDSKENSITFSDKIFTNSLYLGNIRSDSIIFNDLSLSLNYSVEIDSQVYEAVYISGKLIDVKNPLILNGDSVFDYILEGGTKNLYTLSEKINELNFEDVFIENLIIKDIITDNLRFLGIVSETGSSYYKESMASSVLLGYLYHDSKGNELTNLIFEIYKPDKEEFKTKNILDSGIFYSENQLIETPVKIGEITFRNINESVKEYWMGVEENGYIGIKTINYDDNISLKGINGNTEMNLTLSFKEIEADILKFNNVKLFARNVVVNNDVEIIGEESKNSNITLNGQIVNLEGFSIQKGTIIPKFPYSCNQNNSFSEVNERCRALIFDVKVNIRGNLVNHSFEIVGDNKNIEGFKFGKKTLSANNLILFSNHLEQGGTVFMESQNVSFEGTSIIFTSPEKNVIGMSLFNEASDFSSRTLFANSFYMPREIKIGNETISSNSVDGKTGISLTVDDNNLINPYQLSIDSDEEDASLNFASPLNFNNMVKFGNPLSFSPTISDNFIYVDSQLEFIKEGFYLFGRNTIDDENRPAPISLSNIALGMDSEIVLEIGDLGNNINSRDLIEENPYFQLGNLISMGMSVSGLIGYNSDKIQDIYGYEKSYSIIDNEILNFEKLESGFIYMNDLRIEPSKDSTSESKITLNNETFIYSSEMILDRIIGTISIPNEFSVKGLKFSTNTIGGLSGMDISITDLSDGEYPLLAFVVNDNMLVKLNCLGQKGEIPSLADTFILDDGRKFVSFDFFNKNDEGDIEKDHLTSFSISRDDIANPITIDEEIKLSYKKSTIQQQKDVNTFIFEVPDEFEIKVTKIETDSFFGGNLMIKEGSWFNFGPTLSLGPGSRFESSITYELFDMNRNNDFENKHFFIINNDIRLSDNGNIFLRSIHFSDTDSNNKTNITSERISTSTLGAINITSLSYKNKNKLWIENAGSTSNMYIASNIGNISLESMDNIGVGGVNISIDNSHMGIFSKISGQNDFNVLFMRTSIIRASENEISGIDPPGSCSDIAAIHLDGLNKLIEKNECRNFVKIAIPEYSSLAKQKRIVFSAKYIEIDELSILREHICISMKYIGDYYNANRYIINDTELNENPDIPYLSLKLGEEEPDLLITDKVFKISVIQNASYIFANKICLGFDWSNIYLRQYDLSSSIGSSNDKTLCISVERYEDSINEEFFLDVDIKKGLNQINISIMENNRITVSQNAPVNINGIIISQSSKEYNHYESYFIFNDDSNLPRREVKELENKITVFENVDELQFSSLEGKELFTTSNISISSYEGDGMDSVKMLFDSRKFQDYENRNYYASQVPFFMLDTDSMFKFGDSGTISSEGIDLLSQKEDLVKILGFVGSYHTLQSGLDLIVSTEGTTEVDDIYLSSVYNSQISEDGNKMSLSVKEFTLMSKVYNNEPHNDMLKISNNTIMSSGIFNFNTVKFAELLVEGIPFLREGVIMNTDASGGSFREISLGNFIFNIEGNIQKGETTLGQQITSNTFEFSSNEIITNDFILFTNNKIIFKELRAADFVTISSLGSENMDNGKDRLNIPSFTQNSIFEYNGEVLKFCNIMGSNSSIDVKGLVFRKDNCESDDYSLISSNILFNIQRTSTKSLNLKSSDSENISLDGLSITDSLTVGGSRLIGSEEGVVLNNVSDVGSFKIKEFGCIENDGNLTVLCPIVTSIPTSVSNLKVGQFIITGEYSGGKEMAKFYGDGGENIVLETEPSSAIPIVFAENVKIGKLDTTYLYSVNVNIRTNIISSEISFDRNSFDFKGYNIMLNNTGVTVKDTKNFMKINAAKVYPYCNKSVKINYTDSLSFNLSVKGFENIQNGVPASEQSCEEFLSQEPEVNVEFTPGSYFNYSSIYAESIIFRYENVNGEIEEPLKIERNEVCPILRGSNNNIGDIWVDNAAGFARIKVDLTEIQLQHTVGDSLTLFSEFGIADSTNNLTITNFRANTVKGLSSMVLKMSKDFYNDVEGSNDISRLSYLTYDSFKINSFTDMGIKQSAIFDYSVNGQKYNYVFTLDAKQDTNQDPSDIELAFVAKNIYIIMFKKKEQSHSTLPKYKFVFVSMCRQITVDGIGTITCDVQEKLLRVKTELDYTVSITKMEKSLVPS